MALLFGTSMAFAHGGAPVSPVAGIVDGTGTNHSNLGASEMQ
ncbi:MAG TPA: hypothetical protein VEZ44_11465 [bacterium]|nr:hypothetical protein [bacterium]